jgi:BirA family biotin operon repressor/biotin-[acetyl-CoA-carboxylase] ligase
VPDRLRALLGARGTAWMAPIEHFPCVGSTNDVLKERSRADAPEWSLVLADQQTAGRGRQGRAWHSPPGNLYLSVLLRPSLRAERIPVLPLAAGLAVAEGVAELGVEARVKWPNDVLAGGRKLAGVLAEAASGPGGLEAVVLGIGVNVGLSPEQMPEAVRQPATSVRAETGRHVDPVEVAARILPRLADRYDELQRRGPLAVLDAWRERSVAWWGCAVELVWSGRPVEGVVRDVDERGGLIVELADGTRCCLLSGEVRELRSAASAPPLTGSR